VPDRSSLISAGVDAIVESPSALYAVLDTVEDGGDTLVSASTIERKDTS
jgi:hypothetical protein